MSDVTRLSKSTGARGWLAAAALAASAMIPGCQERSASRFDLAAAPAPLVAAGPGAELWAGSQDELAIALDAVAAQVDPGASAALRQRWQGKRVRWSVTRVPALCGPTDPCHVQPFASARRTETSAHGWLPELRFAAGEREKLLCRLRRPAGVRGHRRGADRSAPGLGRAADLRAPVRGARGRGRAVLRPRGPRPYGQQRAMASAMEDAEAGK
ncbi:MAG: hypothetical protein IPI49_29100 [Myxococcales bacterium]|nr:hypothetical protein [Myxococcales bacterium]